MVIEHLGRTTQPSDDLPLSTSADEWHLDDIIDLQRAAHVRDGRASAAVRVDRLDRLKALISDNADELADALMEDYGSRPRDLSLIEIASCLIEIADQRKHLARWMRVSRVGTGLRLVGLDLRINSTPKGVVGIIGPWNFPIQLVIAPAAAALAAGNRVMIRPSSVTARTTAVLAAKAPEYFELEELAIITPKHGGGSDFSKLRFDHLFFTGSPRVGESVAGEAAKNLVPVTLELGGKNPAIVDRETDVATAARRLAFARLINGGQVCLCPDYVFVPREHADDFVKTVLRTWTDSFPTIIENPDFTAIVNNSNYERIVRSVANAVSLGATKYQFVPAGEALPDRATRKIPPTLLTGVTSAMTIENEEVFGPVLTVYAYDDLDEAIAHVNGGDHPLTMYWYGQRNVRFDKLVESTTTGSVNGNDFGPNMASGLVPFGGIGRSGMGNYHGEWGFDTFTHKRAIAYSRLRFSGAQFMAPPYKRLNKVISTALLRRFARARRLRERNRVS